MLKIPASNVAKAPQAYRGERAMSRVERRTCPRRQLFGECCLPALNRAGFSTREVSFSLYEEVSFKSVSVCIYIMADTWLKSENAK